MSATLGVRVPDHLRERLDRLAESTGRSKTFYIRQLIEENFDELEYIYGLERDVEAARRGELETKPLDGLWDELGIDAAEDGVEAQGDS